MARKRNVSEPMRRLVREHAHGRCEHCLIHEEDALFPHEPDHIDADVALLRLNETSRVERRLGLIIIGHYPRHT